MLQHSVGGGEGRSDGRVDEGPMTGRMAFDADKLEAGLAEVAEAREAWARWLGATEQHSLSSGTHANPSHIWPFGGR